MRLPRFDGGDLDDLLARAAAFIDRTSSSTVAAAVFEDEPRRSSLMELVRGVSHVGFLAPRGTSESACAEAARRIGFADSHAFFPSVSVARELSALAGTKAAANVFRCQRGPGGDGRRSWIEAFIVDSAAAPLETWIDEGVASHVGLDAEPCNAARVRALLESGGFAPPAFMRDGPVRNPAERHSMLYLDGRARDGAKLRLELAIEP